MNASGDYRSWSFFDRSFLFAVSVSILWHLFWFFSVNVVVSPHMTKKPTPTKLMSLGPVLDDDIFKTLVESRPEISKAFYRELGEIDKATAVPEEGAPRYETGAVTSLPEGDRYLQPLKSAVGGGKLSMEVLQSPFSLEGDWSSSDILTRPELPQPPAKNIVIEFGVDAQGHVAEVQTLESAGDADTDRRFEDHLRQWVFLPETSADPAGKKGKVTFYAQT